MAKYLKIDLFSAKSYLAIDAFFANSYILTLLMQKVILILTRFLHKVIYIDSFILHDSLLQEVTASESQMKNYQRFSVLRRAEGKNFIPKLSGKASGSIPPHFYSFLLQRFILTFTNLCTQISNFFTHFNKPNLFTGLNSLECGSIFTRC